MYVMQTKMMNCYSNYTQKMKLRKKHVNYVMKKHKMGCNYKEDVKVKYELSLSVDC